MSEADYLGPGCMLSPGMRHFGGRSLHPNSSYLHGSYHTHLPQAQRKYKRDFAGSPVSEQVQVAFGSVRIPPLAPLLNSPAPEAAAPAKAADHVPKPTQVRHIQMVTERTAAAVPQAPGSTAPGEPWRASPGTH